MSTLILFHAVSATIALLIGPIWLFSSFKKSIYLYVMHAWVVLMIIVSITSFWIRDINPGKLSYIHILSVVTLLSIVQYIYLHKKQKSLTSIAKALGGVYIGLFLSLIHI